MAYSRHVIALFGLVGCVGSDEPPPEPCVAEVAYGELTDNAPFAVDDGTIYAIDTRGILQRAALGDGIQPLEDFAPVGLFVEQIVVDAEDLWLVKGDGTANRSLLRVDKTTGEIEVVDATRLSASFAIDDDFVYWLSNAGIARRPKRGGTIETFVPPSEVDTLYSLTIAGGELLAVGTDGHVSQIYAVDLDGQKVRPVGTATENDILHLLGPDEAGRLYTLTTSHEGTTTTAHQWSPSGPGTEVASWNGTLYDTFVFARDGVYVAGADAGTTFVHYPATGGTPDTLATYAAHGINFGFRFAIGSDGAYSTDRHTMFRLPLTGGPYPFCDP